MHARVRRQPALVDVGSPWTNCFGLARSLIAIGPLLTVLFTRGSDLVFPFTDATDPTPCHGAGAVLLFCVGGEDFHPEAKRWLAAALFAAVVIGWRPRVTCLPHAYAAFSFFNGISTPEGGDQISSIVALLLIPVCLTDGRRWHWQPTNGDPEDPRCAPGGTAAAVAVVGIALIKLQVSWLYLQAGISKLSHEAWDNGSAMYYWIRNVDFGAPNWQRGVVFWITERPIPEAVLTWLPIGIEVSLGISLLLPLRARIPLLCAGFLMHLLIGLLIGLWSFAIIMLGCLIFLLAPAGLQLKRTPIRPSEAIHGPAPGSHDSHDRQGPRRRNGEDST